MIHDHTKLSNGEHADPRDELVLFDGVGWKHLLFFRRSIRDMKMPHDMNISCRMVSNRIYAVTMNHKTEGWILGVHVCFDEIIKGRNSSVEHVQRQKHQFVRSFRRNQQRCEQSGNTG